MSRRTVRSRRHERKNEGGARARQVEAVGPEVDKVMADPIRGLDNDRDLFERLQNPDGAFKIYCEVAVA